MIIFGYVKGYQYKNDGTLMIQVRIPTIHGAFNQVDYGGKTVRNYVMDKDLPWFPSVLLPNTPNEGEVVALSSITPANNDFIVIGLTGGSYYTGTTNLGG